MIDDVVKNIKEMQVDLENKISEYGKKVPSKLNIDLIESDGNNNRQNRSSRS